MEQLIRTNIDFSNSVLSTTGSPFTPKDWESIHLNVKDREIALVMSSIGKEFINKKTPSMTSSYLENIELTPQFYFKDIYKITRGAIIDLFLTKNDVVGNTMVDTAMKLANKYIKNSNNRVSNTIYLSDFLTPADTNPITVEIEYQVRPSSSEKKITKILIADKKVDILYNLIKTKINLAPSKYNYTL
jgi:hypothetical protein